MSIGVGSCREVPVVGPASLCELLPLAVLPECRADIWPPPDPFPWLCVRGYDGGGLSAVNQ
jgi:hypothetical protein